MVLEDLMRMIIDGLHGLSHCSQLLSSLNAYIPGARMLFPVSTLSILEVITSSASHSFAPVVGSKWGSLICFT